METNKFLRTKKDQIDIRNVYFSSSCPLNVACYVYSFVSDRRILSLRDTFSNEFLNLILNSNL